MQVNILEAKNQLSRLVRAAQAGEEVVIAQRGKPAVKLVAIDHQATVLDPMSWLQANPLPAHLQRAHVDIEADIQAERDSWD
ncbi:type II toxin-antitoxin system prevent-host-death family antitoxin [Cyanobium sp. Aljojuca 7D2]|jgi:prevent-host-death family protein|uniref:type II toxin-antitoxin system Phd/YefM family antitoxin n=1 Tax=Cyanobium sp. Aljojuca 7D2 TaxID=2823698 RepID=UPI0020CE1A21|nr:type II toxin-antitoxin system prevent-host-death family antitoxin [Cyanobium sp. Aljojuca 7D2]MCP9890691.1 type II toxin-antitoxin system prevent-host-death family antitoxin [Cyanobium sp. Aljojuca 7D2]